MYLLQKPADFVNLNHVSTHIHNINTTINKFMCLPIIVTVE